jgi:hypothetical protein
MVASAAIFRMHGPASRANGPDPMVPSQVPARPAIAPGRTAALGGHVSCCEHGPDDQDREHSGNNRHGPKGQNGSAPEWRQRPRDRRLPLPSCLVPCTVPEAVRALARSHQPLRDTTRFRASGAARQTRALDPRFVGGTLGRIGVLPTGTRALPAPPQGPSLVPAGGWARDGRPGRPSREDCLVPVQALALVVRAKFREARRPTPVSDWGPP